MTSLIPPINVTCSVPEKTRKCPCELRVNHHLGRLPRGSSAFSNASQGGPSPEGGGPGVFSTISRKRRPRDPDATLDEKGSRSQDAPLVSRETAGTRVRCQPPGQGGEGLPLQKVPRRAEPGSAQSLLRIPCFPGNRAGGCQAAMVPMVPSAEHRSGLRMRLQGPPWRQWASRGTGSAGRCMGQFPSRGSAP